MIKVSDFIMKFLYKNGIRDAFMVPGGGAIHLDDSLGRGPLRYYCTHHEQAAAIAAESYARLRSKIALLVVTSGPGGTNTITGVMGGWLDSIPMLVISGQIRRETIGSGKKLRQLGDQEINIIDIVKPITKYAVLIKKPDEIKYHLQKALYLAYSGRPGPVWLDIPLDIQGWYVDEKKLKSFLKTELELPYETDKKKLSNYVQKVLTKIAKSQRPVLYVGNGVRLSGATKELLELTKLLKIPVLTGFASMDLVSTNNPYWGGRPGTIGQRAGNFVLQNSDLLLAIGGRLNVRIIGYDFKTFARAAYKIMVDIDKQELNKKTLNIDMKINYNAKDFLIEMIYQLNKKRLNLEIAEWRSRIKDWHVRYPTVGEEFWKETEYVNPYCFIDSLSKFIKKSDIIALSDATASICTYQAIKFPQGLRIITSSGSAAMGYGLPAAIGACIANNRKATICIEGDGSIQLNIQELQTVVHNKLPIKIFVYSNEGYVSMRLTQKNMFGGKLVGSSNESGISWPNMRKIANAYGIKYQKIKNHNGMDIKIKKLVADKGPIICEVMVSPDQQFLPKASAKKLPNGKIVSRPLEDMFPFLTRDELKREMFIPLVNQD